MNCLKVSNKLSFHYNREISNMKKNYRFLYYQLFDKIVRDQQNLQRQWEFSKLLRKRNLNSQVKKVIQNSCDLKEEKLLIKIKLIQLISKVKDVQILIQKTISLLIKLVKFTIYYLKNQRKQIIKNEITTLRQNTQEFRNQIYQEVSKRLILYTNNQENFSFLDNLKQLKQLTHSDPKYFFQLEALTTILGKDNYSFGHNLNYFLKGINQFQQFPYYGFLEPIVKMEEGQGLNPLWGQTIKIENGKEIFLNSQFPTQNINEHIFQQNQLIYEIMKQEAQLKLENQIKEEES